MAQRSSMVLGAMTQQERAARAPFWLNKRIAAADLTETEADTDQTFAWFDLPPNVGVLGVQISSGEAFEDASDAALNDTKVSVGIAGGTANFATAQQLNVNGTEVLNKFYSLDATSGVQSALVATGVLITVESMSAKSLVDIDTGHVDVRILLVDYGTLEAGKSDI